MKIAKYVLIFLFTSCSLLQQQGVQITAGIIADSAYELETDGNLEFVSQALPANLKFVESLTYIDPENTDLLLALLKGYVGMAFAVNETHYLKEFLKDIDEGPARKQAILNYSKALRYGLRYLKTKDIGFKLLTKSSKNEKIFTELLSSELDTADIADFEAVFFTAQALASLINLQKGNLELVAQLPLAKAMFDWACSINPNFSYGACEIFNASYLASRPRMLGGNPVKAKKLFYASIKKWPSNYLIRIAFLQNYILPLMDEVEFSKQKKAFELFIRKTPVGWSPREMRSEKSTIDAHLNLYNEVAIKRYNIIKRFEKEIF